MKIGQMTFNKISESADYLQLDMCGLSAHKTLNRYLSFSKDIGVILHGDWSKKGCSENNILNRVEEYIETINLLKEVTTVHGITIHPPYRKKIDFDIFLNACKYIEIETKISVFVENRSSSKLWLSTPDEIVNFSKNHDLTIDIPQLFISCNYNTNIFEDTLSKICWNNVKELHLANIKREQPRTYVARKLTDGELKYEKFIHYLIDVEYSTLEILGGHNVFNNEKSYLNKLIVGIN